jgi:hypothetical protein
MPHDVFPLSRILITAVVCALVAFLLLVWRGRGDDAPRTGLILALLIGVLVVVWRIVSNRWYLNDDFFPGVSPSDVGSGVLILLALLALTPIRPSRRAWLATSALIALATFVCNVVLI